MSLRRQVLAFAKKEYGTEAEYPWSSAPGYAVLRHQENHKWYGIIMDVPAEKIGLVGKEKLDILCVRIPDRLYHDMLLKEEGYAPAYHLNRTWWIALRLDGALSLKEIRTKLKESYMATLHRQKKEMYRPPKNWLVPANAHYYDPLQFFSGKNVITYKQSSDVRIGDTVYIYAGMPIGAILYRCRAVKVNIPANEIDQYQIRTTREMVLRLEHRYDQQQFTRSMMMEEYGVYSVRSARSVPNGLAVALEEVFLKEK